jgi:hypothetical protein
MGEILKDGPLAGFEGLITGTLKVLRHLLTSAISRIALSGKLSFAAVNTCFLRNLA